MRKPIVIKKPPAQSLTPDERLSRLALRKHKQEPAVTAEKPSHKDYTLGCLAWEEAVFINAAYFKVVFRQDVNSYLRMQYNTFPEVQQHFAEHPKGERWLAYAIAPDERSVCLERAKFERYGLLWRTYRA